MATDVFTTATLLWAPSHRALSYDLLLWTDGETSLTAQMVDGLSAPNWTPAAPLLFDTVYHWLVIARNSFGETQGAEWTFDTAPEPIP